MNLIITCQRNLEEPTILEIQNILERFGDAERSYWKNYCFQELFKLKLNLDIMKVLKKIQRSN